MCPNFPAVCGQGQVLPPSLARGGCVWPLITHSFQYNWGVLLKMPSFVHMLEGDKSNGTTNGNNFCASPTCCSKPTKTGYCPFLPRQGMRRAAQRVQITLELNPVGCSIHPPTQTPHLLWKRRVAL